MTKPRPEKERRAVPINLDELGIKNPGLARVEDHSKKDVSARDEEWKKADQNLWLHDYPLLLHLLSTQEFLIEAGAERGLDGELAVRAVTGFYHDISKVEEPYNTLSRINGPLSAKQIKIMRRHTHRSAEILQEIKKHVRQEDQQIFDYATPIVRRHDKPHLVFKKWQRQICWDLYFFDGYLAGHEKRHDRSLTMEEALASLRTRSVKQLPRLVRLFYAREIESSIAVVERVIRKPRSDA